MTHEAIPSGTPCGEADICHLVGVCNDSGKCLAPWAPGVDDGDPCTNDECSPEKGISHYPAGYGAPCPDGDACNGEESCDEDGVCRPADPPKTNDDNPCTDDSCDPVLGVLHTPVQLGTICAQADACHGAGECDAEGVCVVPPDPDVDDGNPCTADACDATNGVQHDPEPAAFPCANGDLCDGDESCDGLGVCLHGLPVLVDDQNPCTIDECDAVLGVKHRPVPGGTSCSNDDVCDGVEACDSAGLCVHGAAPTIDDGDACTADACDPDLGVSHTRVQPGTACSDGNACNGAETCDDQGVCVAGSIPALDDGNPCTIDQCDLAAGVTHVPAPDGRSCSDGNACNGMETCHTGACLAGTPPVVDDDNPCTTDSCDPTKGVVHIPTTEGSCFADAVTWQWQPMGRPSPRDSAAVAMDQASGTLVVFGGVNAGVALADLWRLSTATGAWTVKYTALPPRAGAAAESDQKGHVILFGGMSRTANQDAYLDDMWSLDVASGTGTRLDATIRPSARAFAATAFQPDNERLLVVGGMGSGGEALGDVWEWDGTTWAQRMDAETPPARSHGAMAYDPARQRFVLYGGAAGSATAPPLADCWELNTATSTWTACGGSIRPPARLGHSMAFDAGLGRIVVFGGTATSPTTLADTWSYDGNEWISIATTGEPSRVGQGGAFDQIAGVVRSFGGLAFSESGLTTPAAGERWRLDGSSGWALDQPMIAPAAIQLGLVYDSARQSFVTVGRNFWAALWRYDTIDARWSFEEPGEDAAILPTVGAHQLDLLFYDAVGDRLGYVGHGGGHCTFGGPAWPAVMAEINNGVWSRRDCSSAPYLRRFAAAHDLARNRLVVFGGLEGTSCEGTLSPRTYEVDLATCDWSLMPIDWNQHPSPRLRSVMAWDSIRGVTVLYGGTTSTGQATDTWEYDGTAWHDRAAAPNPGARDGAVMAFDATRGRVVLFGGVDPQGSYLNDTWEYDGVAGSWIQLPVVGDRPSPRMDAGIAFDRGRGLTVLMGGVSAGHVEHTDMWEWDGASWQRRWYGASPAARSGAGAAGANYGAPSLFGGVAGDGQRAYLQDTWLWRDGEWLSATPPSAGEAGYQAFSPVSRWVPQPRAGHALAGYATTGTNWDETRAVLFGGEGDEGVLGDTWRWTQDYLWVADSQPAPGGRLLSSTNDPHWQEARCQYGSPPARTGSAIAPASLNEWILFGGEGESGELLGDTWTFLYGSEQWWELRLEHGPAARSGHAMVLDEARARILLFGGRDSEKSALNDTWEFDPARPDGAKWAKLNPTHYPPRRFGHSMWYDRSRGVIVLTGGSGTSATTGYQDVWEWDGAGDWTPRMTAVPDAPRVGHAAFFDDQTGQGVVFGGLAYSSDGRATSTYGDTVALVDSDGSNALPLVYPDGTPCAGRHECGSGFCADGVCCDSPCDGQCANCAQPGREGQCVAVSGQPRVPRDPCGGSTMCDGVCDGQDPQQCHPPPIGTICSSDACSNGSHVLPGACDAGRHCAVTTESCAPFGCDAGACVYYCGPSVPCSPGWFCGSSYPGAWVCAGEARVLDFRVTPDANVTIGQAVSLSASAMIPPANVSYSWWRTAVYRFSYRLGAGDAVYPCGDYQSAASCSFVPIASGTYLCRVEVRNYESPNATDDYRELTLTVGKP